MNCRQCSTGHNRQADVKGSLPATLQELWAYLEVALKLCWSKHGDEAPNRSEGYARLVHAMSTCWKHTPPQIIGGRAHREDTWKYTKFILSKDQKWYNICGGPSLNCSARALIQDCSFQVAIALVSPANMNWDMKNQKQQRRTVC